MVADKGQHKFADEIEQLRSRVEEAEATLSAIRSGEVDALVVVGPNGNQVYTLQHAEHPYRVFFESMQEGAVTLSDTGLILYCNHRFATMLKIPLEKVLGASIELFLTPDNRPVFRALLSRSQFNSNHAEVSLAVSDGTALPISVALSPLSFDNTSAICVVATDLSLQKQREQEILHLQKELENRVIERTAELSQTNHRLELEVKERIRIAEQIARLQTVTTALSATLNSLDVANVFINDGLAAVGAISGAVLLLSEDNQLLKLIKSSGYSKALNGLFYSLPIHTARRIFQTCIHSQQPIWDQHSETFFTNDLILNIPLTHADERWSVIPLKGNNQLMGLLILGFAATELVDDEKRGFILTLSAQCSQAFHRAYLYEHAQTTAATEERQRLARDLHDAVSQTLFSANIIAETLPRLAEQNPERAMKQLSEVSRLTRGALAEMRALLLELRPSALVNTKLTDLVQQLVNAIQVKKKIAITAILEENHTLPDEVHVCLYRILQEALNNVVKHSRATAVTITLHSDGRQARLEVSDNGTGFDTVSPKGGLGLGMMRERAQGIHGDLQVISTPGQGTTIRVSWVDMAGIQESLPLDQ